MFFLILFVSVSAAGASLDGLSAFQLSEGVIKLFVSLDVGLNSFTIRFLLAGRDVLASVAPGRD